MVSDGVSDYKTAEKGASLGFSWRQPVTARWRHISHSYQPSSTQW